jgi:hypothetical protein
MPEPDKKANKTKALQGISKDYIQPENLRLIGGRIHVTAKWLSARFNITYALLTHIIEQHLSQYIDNDHWIDDALFIEICNSPILSNTFGEAERGTVLQLLGHYRDMSGVDA